MHIAKLYPRLTEPESLWVELGSLHFYQMLQVILRHKKVQEQLNIMHKETPSRLSIGYASLVQTWDGRVSDLFLFFWPVFWTQFSHITTGMATFNLFLLLETH